MLAAAMPTTPHDALFKWTFSQIEHAEAALRSMLPSAIVARTDFSTLALCPGSFVDEELRERHTDLLFSATIDGRSARIYVLLEHMSYVERLYAFLVLRYLVRIWEDFLKKHPDAQALPAILPLVIHHSETGWTAKVRFEELIDVDAETLAILGDHIPRFRFLLDDLSATSDEALRARVMSAFGRLVLFCLKHARAPEELIERLRAFREILGEARRARNGRKALSVLWRYIFSVGERYEPEELPARLTGAVGEEEKEELVNVAEKLVERGRQEGQRKTLLKLLACRFGNLPELIVSRVNAAGTAELDQWTERVLTVPTLAELLNET